MAGSDVSRRISVVDLSLGLQTVPIGVECDSLAIHGICSFEVAWDAGERVFCRGERHANADYHIVEAVLPRLSIQHLPLMIVEYKLRDEQDREQR
jgi:hypothetical protein